MNQKANAFGLIHPSSFILPLMVSHGGDENDAQATQNGEAKPFLPRIFPVFPALPGDPERRHAFHGWENLARRLVSDFLYNTRTLTHLSEYKSLVRSLREYPEYRRIAATVYTRNKPAPSFVFQIQHSELGRLTLRTATTVFTNLSNYSMVSYVPGDQQTLEIYRAQGWQPM